MGDGDPFKKPFYETAATWMRFPQRSLDIETFVNLDFKRWVKAHNNMIINIETKKKGKRDSGDNAKFKIRFQNNCKDLAKICEKKAKTLLFLAEGKNVTKFLGKEFRWRAYELKKFSAFIAKFEEKNESTRWI